MITLKGHCFERLQYCNSSQITVFFFNLHLLEDIFVSFLHAFCSLVPITNRYSQPTCVGIFDVTLVGLSRVLLTLVGGKEHQSLFYQ